MIEPLIFPTVARAIGWTRRNDGTDVSWRLDPLERTILRRKVTHLLTCAGRSKKEARQRVIEELRRARSFATGAFELLRICIASRGPGRLDVAIDTLSAMGPRLYEFVQQAVRDWSPDGNEAYPLDDDYWYVLLRAVARSSFDADKRYRLMAGLRRASRRGIRESVVEALGDLGGDKPRRLLQEIARDDSDPFVQRLATETLEDLSGE